MRKTIYCGTSCNLDQGMLQANLPLFISESVEALEWSFDTLRTERTIPDWFVELLRSFGDEGRLVGHGVFFSLFSGRWSKEQELWLEHLRKVSRNFTFDHITEHFGFMTGEDFHKGAPLSVPFNETTLRIGTDRLLRIYEACGVPVGLENLAFAYSPDEVKQHGEFLEKLITPVNGFIILDLHNLYCQLHNFDIHFEEIISLYPLDKVREIHISGGSWESSETDPGKVIRRDTHDSQVPEEVFVMLEKAILICPNLRFVIMEQLGPALTTIENQEQFRKDFNRMKNIVASVEITQSTTNNFLPAKGVSISGKVAEDHILYMQQKELSDIIENASDIREVQITLRNSSLANSDWKIEDWTPAMLETAVKIARKWKAGWDDKLKG